MRVGIRLRVDVSKIDKARLFKGEKGTYLDATAFVDIDNPDKYGNNGMITQDVPKDSGENGAILGNAKVFWKDGQAAGKASGKSSGKASASFDEDVPFAQFMRDEF